MKLCKILEGYITEPDTKYLIYRYTEQKMSKVCHNTVHVSKVDIFFI